MAANLRSLVHDKELISHVEEEYGTQKRLLGFYKKFYLSFKWGLQSYVELSEDSFSWMNELLAECRDTFKTPEVHLIPKTPSVKQRKRRGRPARTDSEENEHVPQKKTRNTRQKQSKGDSGVGGVHSNADDDESEEQQSNAGSGRVTRQTRTSSKTTRSQRSTRTRKGQPAEDVEKIEEDIQEPISQLKFAVPESTAELNSEKIASPAKQAMSVPCVSLEYAEENTREADEAMEVSPVKDVVSPAVESTSDLPDGAEKTAVSAKSDPDMVSSSDEQVLLEAPSEDDCEIIPDSPAVLKHDTSARQLLRRSSTNMKTSLQKQVQRLSTINKSKSRQRSSMYRHQLRKSVQLAAKMAMEEAQEVEQNQADTAEDEVIAASPANPKRVTRSKMRHPKTARGTDSDSCMAMKSSADEGDDEDEMRKVMPPPPRPTRSKMRSKMGSQIANASVSTSSDDEESDKPARSFRSTRSKMRSNADTSDSHSSPYTPVRSAQKKGHFSALSPSSEASSMDKSYVKRFGKPVIMNSSSNPFKKNVVPTSNLNNIVSEFLKRNTPKKKVNPKELAENKKQEMKEKEKEAADRLRRQQEDQKKKAEEIKRQREDRRRLVAQRREEMNQLNQQAKADESKANKLLESKQREEREKQKLREKRQAEVEQRRKQEEDIRLKKLHELEIEQRRKEEALQKQREQEEMERQRRLVEQRKLEEMRRLEQEKQRKDEDERLRKELAKKRIEEEQQRRLREERERREKEERERQEIERQKERERQKLLQIEKEKELERQRLKDAMEKEKLQREEERKAAEMLKKHNGVLQNSSINSSNKLNTTITKDDPTMSNPPKATSIYDVHPNLPKPHHPHYTDYNINTLNSDDSTDDESQPKKKIPKWAEGSELRIAMVNQRFHPPDLDELFRDCMEDMDLSNVFKVVKPRFKNRTSSAIWDSPPMKPSGKYFT